MVAATPRCLTLLAFLGATTGLDVYLPYQIVMSYLLQWLVALTLAGSYFSFRRQQNKWLCSRNIASSIVILRAYQIEFSVLFIYSGLSGVLASLWPAVENRYSVSRSTKQITFRSIITCPNSRYQHSVTLPDSYCLYFYQCLDCKVLLNIKQDDCCVFCSYGSMKCPSTQSGNRCVSC